MLAERRELLEIVSLFAEAVGRLRGAGERLEAVLLLLNGRFEMRLPSRVFLAGCRYRLLSSNT